MGIRLVLVLAIAVWFGGTSGAPCGGCCCVQPCCCSCDEPEPELIYYTDGIETRSASNPFNNLWYNVGKAVGQWVWVPGVGQPGMAALPGLPPPMATPQMQVDGEPTGAASELTGVVDPSGSSGGEMSAVDELTQEPEQQQQLQQPETELGQELEPQGDQQLEPESGQELVPQIDVAVDQGVDQELEPQLGQPVETEFGQQPGPQMTESSGQKQVPGQTDQQQGQFVQLPAQQFPVQQFPQAPAQQLPQQYPQPPVQQYPQQQPEHSQQPTQQIPQKPAQQFPQPPAQPFPQQFPQQYPQYYPQYYPPLQYPQQSVQQSPPYYTPQQPGQHYAPPYMPQYPTQQYPQQPGHSSPQYGQPHYQWPTAQQPGPSGNYQSPPYGENSGNKFKVKHSKKIIRDTYYHPVEPVANSAKEKKT
nr:glutenin, high molecular weight subunit DX5-like [Aedes albopictus]